LGVPQKRLQQRVGVYGGCESHLKPLAPRVI